MAKASVVLKCKHCGEYFTHEKANIRTSGEARDYEDWAKEHIDTCPVCYAIAKRDEEIAKSKELSKSFNLSELSGSEKQISWAETIRAKALTSNATLRKYSAEDIISSYDKIKDNTSAYNESAVKAVKKAYKILTETSAKWFIDNRFDLN